MTAANMQPQVIQQIVDLMHLEYQFAQTGRGWDDYAAAREKLVARMGKAPSTFPGTPNDPYWDSIRRFYFYNPAPTLRRLRVPTLALFFGGLDDNILAAKNKAAWEAALKAGGNPDYSLLILPSADHLYARCQCREQGWRCSSLQHFVPAYLQCRTKLAFAKRVRGFN